CRAEIHRQKNTTTSTAAMPAATQPVQSELDLAPAGSSDRSGWSANGFVSLICAQILPHRHRHPRILVERTDSRPDIFQASRMPSKPAGFLQAGAIPPGLTNIFRFHKTASSSDGIENAFPLDKDGSRFYAIRIAAIQCG